MLKYFPNWVGAHEHMQKILVGIVYEIKTEITAFTQPPILDVICFRVADEELMRVGLLSLRDELLSEIPEEYVSVFYRVLNKTYQEYIKELDLDLKIFAEFVDAEYSDRCYHTADRIKYFLDRVIEQYHSSTNKPRLKERVEQTLLQPLDDMIINIVADSVIL